MFTILANLLGTILYNLLQSARALLTSATIISENCVEYPRDIQYEQGIGKRLPC